MKFMDVKNKKIEEIVEIIDSKKFEIPVLAMKLEHTTRDYLKIPTDCYFANTNLFAPIYHDEGIERMAFNSHCRRASYYGHYKKEIDIYNSMISKKERIEEIKNRIIQMEKFANHSFDHSLIE